LTPVNAYIITDDALKHNNRNLSNKNEPSQLMFFSSDIGVQQLAAACIIAKANAL
jgi:hypothetical protein